MFSQINVFIFYPVLFNTELCQSVWYLWTAGGGRTQKTWKYFVCYIPLVGFVSSFILKERNTGSIKEVEFWQKQKPSTSDKNRREDQVEVAVICNLEAFPGFSTFLISVYFSLQVPGTQSLWFHQRRHNQRASLATSSNTSLLSSAVGVVAAKICQVVSFMLRRY